MRVAHTPRMRVGLVLLLAAPALFAVVPSDSLAIRFADTPCVRAARPGVPRRRRGQRVCRSTQRRGRVRPCASVSVQSSERVLATRPCARQGRTTPRHTRDGGHLVVLGRVERRGPTLGRVVQASEVGARVHHDGCGSTSHCGIGLRVTGQRRRRRRTGVVCCVGNASARPRAESNHGRDHGHTGGDRHVRVQTGGDGYSRRHRDRGHHDHGLSGALPRADKTRSCQSW